MVSWRTHQICQLRVIAKYIPRVYKNAYPTEMTLYNCFLRWFIIQLSRVVSAVRVYAQHTHTYIYVRIVSRFWSRDTLAAYIVAWTIREHSPLCAVAACMAPDPAVIHRKRGLVIIWQIVCGSAKAPWSNRCGSVEISLHNLSPSPDPKPNRKLKRHTVATRGSRFTMKTSVRELWLNRGLVELEAPSRLRKGFAKQQW